MIAKYRFCFFARSRDLQISISTALINQSFINFVIISIRMNNIIQRVNHISALLYIVLIICLLIAITKDYFVANVIQFLFFLRIAIDHF